MLSTKSRTPLALASTKTVPLIVAPRSPKRYPMAAVPGARGMPLVVEISVAFSVLIAFIVFGVFVFRIRERFDTVDVGALDRFRGERGDHL